MLLGLTEPTSGRAEVAGFDPLREPLEVKRRVGYLPDQVGFYDGLSARDNLAYTGRLAGLSRPEIDERFAAALDRVGLGEVGRARVATFSQGMRQRLGLAEILMKRPSVAILDEPTTALDPAFDAGISRDDPRLSKPTGPRSCCLRTISTRCRACATGWPCSIAAASRSPGTVTELAGRVLGGGHVIDVEARGTGVGERLAAMPGIVRVQLLGSGPDSQRYRVDCQRDLRAEIARRLAAEVELTRHPLCRAEPQRGLHPLFRGGARCRAIAGGLVGGRLGSPWTGLGAVSPRRPPTICRARACASSKRWCF